MSTYNGEELELKHRSEDDREQGLYSKYLVIKRRSDEVIWRSFVLRYDQDPFAIPALRAYADACAERYPKLANDLREIADFEEVQQARLRAGLDRVSRLSAEGKLGGLPTRREGER